ncbi:MAG TPA: hypothetical protein VGD62_07380 [Acidobacteriaceae bacterium]
MLLSLACLLPVETAAAQTTAVAGGSFDKLADDGLGSMRAAATERKVSGVAVVAFFEGPTVQAWTSKMVVVGRMKDEPSGTEKGNNLLAIVYAKAAEMADTLKNSGSKVRPPMTGEFGWEGGVIEQVKGGYLIAAFSGGPSADDVTIAHVGLDRMSHAWKAGRQP